VTFSSLAAKEVATYIETGSKDELEDDEVLVNPNQNLVFLQILGCIIGLEVFVILEHAPEHVSPVKAMLGRVRIFFVVGVFVVKAMRANPADRAALPLQTAADGHKVVEPLGAFKGLVREQAMEAHGDTQSATHPGEDQEDDQARP